MQLPPSARILVIASAFGTLACLGPRASDDVVDSPEWLPFDVPVPECTSNPRLMQQIDKFDGIDSLYIPRQRAYAGGQEVMFWDFGVAPRFAVPVWLFRRCGLDGKPLMGDEGQLPLREPIDNQNPTAPLFMTHPNLIDVVPGDSSYSPFWSMSAVCINEADYEFRGRPILASFQAISHAVQVGMAAEPMDMGMWANCPVVSPLARLDVGLGAPPVPPHGGFYKGHKVYYYHLGRMDPDPCNPMGPPSGVYKLDTAGLVATGLVYMFERETGGPSCPRVFQFPRRLPPQMGGCKVPEYSPLWREVRVTLIDSAQCFMSEAEMFNRAPGGELVYTQRGSAAIVRHEVTDNYVNNAIQWEAGLE